MHDLLKHCGDGDRGGGHGKVSVHQVDLVALCVRYGERGNLPVGIGRYGEVHAFAGVRCGLIRSDDAVLGGCNRDGIGRELEVGQHQDVRRGHGEGVVLIQGDGMVDKVVDVDPIQDVALRRLHRQGNLVAGVGNGFAGRDAAVDSRRRGNGVIRGGDGHGDGHVGGRHGEAAIRYGHLGSGFIGDGDGAERVARVGGDGDGDHIPGMGGFRYGDRGVDRRVDGDGVVDLLEARADGDVGFRHGEGVICADGHRIVVCIRDGEGIQTVARVGRDGDNHSLPGPGGRFVAGHSAVQCVKNCDGVNPGEGGSDGDVGGGHDERIGSVFFDCQLYNVILRICHGQAFQLIALVGGHSQSDGVARGSFLHVSCDCAVYNTAVHSHAEQGVQNGNQLAGILNVGCGGKNLLAIN